jgi:hypothetical protein
MQEGKCPNCGLTFSGWALKNPNQRTCPGCGTSLEIRDESKDMENKPEITLAAKQKVCNEEEKWIVDSE